METRYVAEFKIDQITGQRDGDKKKDANNVVKKERTFDSKTIGKGVATGVAVAMVTSNIYAKMQSTSNTITGNAVAQRRLDNKMAYLNEGLGTCWYIRCWCDYRWTSRIGQPQQLVYQ